jgi:type I restriction enzyme S subunit
MTATSKGTKMPRGDKQAIMNWRARKPPLPTQRAIADTLSCLDAKIALNKRINENLEEQAQAIFKSWFVDFEPFQDSDFVESQYGWIPQGWRLGRLGEFIEVTSGKRPIVKTNQRTPNNKVPVIGASRVMGYTNESLFDDRVLVIGRVGTHGVVQRIDFPCWPSDNTLVIKSQFYEFAYQVLKRIDYSSINRGSTQPLITQRDLRNQVIVVPPESVLRRYEDVASSLLEVVRNNLRENQTLSSLRDTLLPKLMSGEIEVPIV